MKLYKFRSLADENDLGYAKEILEKGIFHCSAFSELNDPVEGGFTIFPNDNKLDDGVINAIYEDKNKYRICSFSGNEAFENPIMWGYYANGFRGIAIEIEINESEVHKITYVDKIPHVKDEQDITRETERILTTKLKYWEHEFEYRFLTRSEESKNKIGKITAVYFGNPYERAVNQERIYEKSPALSNFKNWRRELVKAAGTIKCYSVSTNNKENKVQKDKLIKLDLSENQTG